MNLLPEKTSKSCLENAIMNAIHFKQVDHLEDLGVGAQVDPNYYELIPLTDTSDGP